MNTEAIDVEGTVVDGMDLLDVIVLTVVLQPCSDLGLSLYFRQLYDKDLIRGR